MGGNSKELVPQDAKHLSAIIEKRRSIRKFKKDDIDKIAIREIINAGRWAPSGLNNQPWKFKILKGEEKDLVSKFTKYSHVVKGANVIILVFLDRTDSYHREKDFMAIGACIQNMLLSAYSLKIGTCWLGEILNQKEKIRKFLKLGKNIELAAVVALGKTTKYPKRSNRKKMKELVI